MRNIMKEKRTFGEQIIFDVLHHVKNYNYNHSGVDMMDALKLDGFDYTDMAEVQKLSDELRESHDSGGDNCRNISSDELSDIFESEGFENIKRFIADREVYAKPKIKIRMPVCTAHMLERDTIWLKMTPGFIQPGQAYNVHYRAGNFIVISDGKGEFGIVWRGVVDVTENLTLKEAKKLAETLSDKYCHIAKGYQIHHYVYHAHYGSYPRIA